MKKILLFATAMVLISTALHAVQRQRQSQGGPPSEVSIEVRTAQVKASPSYMSQTIGNLKYGDRVSVAGEQGNWYQIAAPAGWIPKSAATSRKVAVDSDKRYAAAGVKHDEAALAGKGFNPQVEGEYKKNNANLVGAFAEVDRVETFTASEASLKQFIASGHLNPMRGEI